MVNLWFGVAWIVMGLFWLRKAYTGEKAGATITLSHPEDLVISKRERVMALILAIASMVLGLADIWRGLRHRG